jgi:hypothetical protein
MVDVLADIITEHEFTFTSPRLLDYDHCATVPPVTKKLNLPFPLNKGDWTVTHAKQGPTVSFSLGWKGIRPGVLKDVEVTQVITCTGITIQMTISCPRLKRPTVHHKLIIWRTRERLTWRWIIRGQQPKCIAHTNQLQPTCITSSLLNSTKCRKRWIKIMPRNLSRSTSVSSSLPEFSQSRFVTVIVHRYYRSTTFKRRQICVPFDRGR